MSNHFHGEVAFTANVASWEVFQKESPGLVHLVLFGSQHCNVACVTVLPLGLQLNN
jgi:hypothetical protein